METFVLDVHLTETIVVRIAASLILGLIIGFERSIAHKKIGFRTLSLVCTGSCAFTIVSIFGFDGPDNSRVAAQIVSGIGFLGAGAIIHTGVVARGLTTAAALWLAAAIGVACGTGMLFLALVTTITALIVLWGLKPVRAKFLENGNGDKTKPKGKTTTTRKKST